MTVVKVTEHPLLYMTVVKVTEHPLLYMTLEKVTEHPLLYMTKGDRTPIAIYDQRPQNTHCYI